MKILLPLLLLTASLGHAAPTAATATLTGRVPLPAAAAPALVPQRYDIVAQDGVVATNPPVAVIYLEGNFPPPAEPPVVEMAQKDLAFSPSLLPVRTGTRVAFPNEDDTFHNVFSFSPTKRFDLGRYRPQDRPVPTVLFDQPGLVTLRCEIHKHMRGLILVLDSPHFVVTDLQGRYRLEHIPPGKYILKAWIDSHTTLAKPVEVVAGQILEADLP